MDCIINNQKFDTYQLSEPLPIDTIRNIWTISRREIGVGFGWLIIGLPTVSNWYLYWYMISTQQTESWTDDWAQLWGILIASSISTWQISEGRASSNRQNCNCRFLVIRRDLEINTKIWNLHLPPRHLSFSPHTEEMYEGEGYGRSIAHIVWIFEVTASITTRLFTSLFHHRKKSCLWQDKIGVISSTLE